MLRVYPMYQKIPVGCKSIDVTSRNRGWGKGLSPFYLEGGHLYSDYQSVTMENAWQFSKVYACHVDSDGEPTKEYWEWALDGYSNQKANRHPMGKGVKPLYFAWNNRKLNYSEARKEIYIPLYSRAVIKTESYSKLVELFNECNQNNIDLYIRDFDGYDFKQLGMSYEDTILNLEKPMGHGIVLSMMLENKIINN